MSIKANESFSAFLDDEASELDVQRMLKALEDDPSLMEHWQQLSKVNAAAQGWPVVESSSSLASESMQSVEEKAHNHRSWFRLETSVAAVAFLVVVSIVGFAGRNSLERSPELVLSELQPMVNFEQNMLAKQRLEQMLKQHVERASFSTGRAVVPSQIEFQFENTI